VSKLKHHIAIENVEVIDKLFEFTSFGGKRMKSVNELEKKAPLSVAFVSDEEDEILSPF
jgi:hypothetical protein